MKNKSGMILLGIGVAYLLYRLYAKNQTMLPPGILQTNEEPLALYPGIRADTEQILSNGGAYYNQPERVFAVDNVRDEAIDYNIPNTYQTFYGRNNYITGAISKVPSTC